MRAIYKEKIEIGGFTYLEVARGAKFLDAKFQGRLPQRDVDLCVWFVCDPEAEKEQRKIVALETGAPFPDEGVDGISLDYIGTDQLESPNDGQLFVIHVFEAVEV